MRERRLSGRGPRDPGCEMRGSGTSPSHHYLDSAVCRIADRNRDQPGKQAVHQRAPECAPEAVDLHAGDQGGNPP
ncbi:hypothetical protein RZS08_35360, partial [Arthrospira platensis SPKY1]|nr:hypothetical protein [Arthrospira platensis SPKY1]